MPYKDLDDLPGNVRARLPKHAQEIYRAAYNHAWAEYGHDEERAHKVAWSTVGKRYEKDAETGDWQPKAEE
ncbi:ChaB family protein [Methylomagnum ishizawai]|uniref:ChaB family protein n=1 Tax=Methylomagnum ishizawai TaxID=1760988 RepID=UPI001C33652D|nr:ChaB family protein [Methylomagnum ishizawai]BBL77402.1 cation transport regulator [Methylomagnum ishizawai]